MECSWIRLFTPPQTKILLWTKLGLLREKCFLSALFLLEWFVGNHHPKDAVCQPVRRGHMSRDSLFLWYLTVYVDSDWIKLTEMLRADWSSCVREKQKWKIFVSNCNGSMWTRGNCIPTRSPMSAQSWTGIGIGIMPHIVFMQLVTGIPFLTERKKISKITDLQLLLICQFEAMQNDKELNFLIFHFRKKVFGRSRMLDQKRESSLGGCGVLGNKRWGLLDPPLGQEECLKSRFHCTCPHPLLCCELVVAMTSSSIPGYPAAMATGNPATNRHKFWTQV